MECRIEVAVSGKTVDVLGDLLLMEDLVRGSQLVFALGGQATAPQIGQSVTLRVHAPGRGGRLFLEIKLWVIGVTIADDGRGTHVEVRAADPLEFCAVQRQFVSYAGRQPLLRLADAVLRSQPGRLERLAAAEGVSPQVAQEWLLQCDETGREFLERVARGTGQALYWDRRHLVCGSMGRGPDRNGAQPIQLAMGKDLFRATVEINPGLDRQTLFWADPSTRRLETLAFPGIEGESRNARRTQSSTAEQMGSQSQLARRVASSVRPAVAAEGSDVSSEAWGRRLSIETTETDITLGATVAAPGQPEALVTRIEHLLHAQGSYENRIVLVTRTAWGMDGVDRARGLRGPFLAQVSHNDDPNGRQRIRVILSEDPERRPTPWLPSPTPSAGPGSGCYWLPEVGDLVLLVADAACPEVLHCLTGVRGNDQVAPAAWRSDRNQIKIFGMREGLRIIFDEKKRLIRLETGGSSLELHADGRILLSGREMQALMETHMRLDANSIDIG